MSDPSVSTTPAMYGADDDMFSTTKVSYEQWNIMFGIQSSVLFFLGYKVYNWYPQFIQDNYVERQVGTYVKDLQWAQSTREITAWTAVSDTLLFVQGSYWLIWLANFTLDNEGGNIHHLFHIAVKCSQLFPWYLIALAYKVNVSYPQSK